LLHRKPRRQLSDYLSTQRLRACRAIRDYHAARQRHKRHPCRRELFCAQSVGGHLILSLRTRKSHPSRLKVKVAVNSRDACSALLFSTSGRRSPPARAIHFVGNFRRFRDALAPYSSLAAYRLSHMGNLDGIAPLPLSADSAGELARDESWDFAIPGRILTSLSR
jgi:hypothetical protein